MNANAIKSCRRSSPSNLFYYFAPIFIQLLFLSPCRAEDWLSASAKNICIGKTVDCKSCQRANVDPKTGVRQKISGSTGDSTFIVSGSHETFGSIHYLMCLNIPACYDFRIRDRRVNCDEFVLQIQQKQKDCNGCIETQDHPNW